MAGDISQALPPVPDVRQDLTLYEAGFDADGVPIWHLHDPLANKFYRLEERDVELLALIGQRNVQEVVDSAQRLLATDVSPEEIEDLVNFLRFNNLVRADPTQQAFYMEQLAAGRQQKPWMLALKNPLFFRVPLVNPDRFLDETLPYLRWLGNRVTLWAFAVVALLSFYLVSRQFDQFLSTFLYFFNWSGMVVYLLALALVKVLHELGHAYAAKAAGCRVPNIGVAFLVGWPVLFTDTSDAWKIPDRNKRLRIGVAGVTVELVIAAVSLFLWSITPDGSFKSALFLLATTTWLLSIAVNFNPLLRFDGYYLFSDLLEVPNLEIRSFNMAKWWVREKLFGLGDQPPEPFRRWFVVFAFAVWTYRFFLFLGIALLVYMFFFKAAGIALFIAEVVLLIGRPVFKELAVWWSMRDRIHWNKTTIRTTVVIGSLLGLLFIPWRSDIAAPSLLTSRSTDIYLPEAGQIYSLPDRGLEIGEEDVLYKITSSKLDHEVELLRSRYRELSWLQQSLGFDSELRSQAMIVASELKTQNQRLRSILDQREDLRVKAPFKGTFVDMPSDLRIGDWLPRGIKLGTVYDESQTKVIAYIKEDDLSRVTEGMTARFYPENPEFGVHDLIVESIDFVATTELDKLDLASTFGGDIAVRESKQGELKLVRSHYKLELVFLESIPSPGRVVRGTAFIDGRAVSPFTQIRRRLTSVFLRETGI